MSNKTPEEGPPVNEAFRAIADPSRRRILRWLQGGNLTAGEIAARFDMTWPSVSHHLKVLREANLVQVERHGTELVYSLHTTVIQELLTDIWGLLGENEDED